MKKVTLFTAIVAVFTLFSLNMNAQSKVKPTEEAVKNLKPYPETLEELERHVIFVDQKENENLFEVELIAGKVMEVDCNNHRLIGEFSEDHVKGWGYSYHVFETEGHAVSTMMACMDPKTKKFVAAESTMVRYNSRLPLVVYLPKGYELKYKIWTAGEERTAEKK